MPRSSPVIAVWVGWVIARLLLGAIIAADSSPISDVNYYFGGVDEDGGLREYPHAATWLLHGLYGLTGGRLAAFQVGFGIMCLLIDALILALLLRSPLPSARILQAGWFWVFFGTACGQVFVMRLDLVPAALVGGFAALLFVNASLAAVALAAATAVKLWPGVLGAGLVGHWRSSGTWRRVLVFFATLSALGLITWAVAGSDRLLSPLEYQGERGLQVESVAATVAVVAAQVNPGAYEVAFADSKSWEIDGPGVAALIALADVAMLLVVAGAVGWAVSSLWRDRFSPVVAVAFGVTVIAGLLVANKVFSPQYVIWLGPIVAVAIRNSTSRWPPLLGVLAVLCAGLSTVIYPFAYGDILSPGSGWVGVAALVVRNLLVVVFAGFSLAWLRAETLAHRSRRAARAANAR